MNDGLLRLVDGVRLTPTQRRIAQCLLDRPVDAAFLSSNEVAELARVSQPSVTRFAMALGFDGYPALRRALRDPGPSGLTRPAGQATPSSLAGPSSQAHGSDPGDFAALDTAPRNELQHAIDGELDNLGRLADRLAEGGPDRAAVEAAGKLLIASPALPVLGLRAAAPMATYFGYFAAKIHPDVRVFDQGGTLLDDRIEQARAAGATAMLAVVLPRYPKEALDALDTARAAGLSLVVLTDSPISPAAAVADVTLSAAVGARLVFDLHVAPMALAMILLQAMCDAAPATTQARLEQFESSAARRNVFVR
ncbi:MurR/RpiR family transcriptional regulator [Rugosimonospora africana]|uniref:MurR/RpiR family transcriptional regulator n=1 Tax=Rugosimonospora africana TaxID=556532 RepID=UPI0019428C39|nr:MurR/RpiR family transcriptional regulator [Rugosimonospora africana]